MKRFVVWWFSGILEAAIHSGSTCNRLGNSCEFLEFWLQLKKWHGRNFSNLSFKKIRRVFPLLSLLGMLKKLSKGGLILLLGLILIFIERLSINLRSWSMNPIWQDLNVLGTTKQNLLIWTKTKRLQSGNRNYINIFDTFVNIRYYFAVFTVEFS